MSSDVSPQREQALALWHPDEMQRTHGAFANLASIVKMRHLVPVRDRNGSFLLGFREGDGEQKAPAFLSVTVEIEEAIGRLLDVAAEHEMRVLRERGWIWEPPTVGEG